jgi:hypothetical protein
MKEKNALVSLSSSGNSTEVSLQKILTSKTSPSLSEIKKKKGQQTALGVLVALMDECQQYFNLQQPMNAHQLKISAELIMEDYYYLRVDELRMCFRMAMKGEFGSVYNRIDGQIFFEWILKYMKKRQLVTDKINKDEQSNSNIYDLFNYPQLNKAVKQVVDKLKIEQAPVQEAMRPKMSRFEKMMLDEYDALPLWDNDQRFRVYNNQPYQFTEYRKARVTEIIEEENEY